nr:hypothetical protein [Burkholderia ambifaria]
MTTNKLSLMKRRLQMQVDDIIPVVGDGKNWAMTAAALATFVGPYVPVSEDLIEGARVATEAADRASQAAALAAASTAAIAQGSSPDAGDLTGAEIIPGSRGAGLIQTTLDKVAAWTLQSHTSEQPYDGAASISQRDFNKQFVDVMQFRGADPSGVTDSTDAFLRAIATGKIVRFDGTFRIRGLPIVPGVHLAGVNMNRSKLWLADGANSHMIYGVDPIDVVLQDFYLYGNKANQSLGADSPWRGVYFSGNAARIFLQRIWVDQIRDHGISLPYVGSSGGKTSSILSCIATGCGSADHVAAGGPGGTGIGAGNVSSIVAYCYSYGNYLNGFKSSSGNYLSCVSEGNGGGFETGFVSANMRENQKLMMCRAIANTNSGYRHQGEGRWIEMFGCDGLDNGSSGMDCFGGVMGLTVLGGTFARNGKSNVRTVPSYGLDGITLYGENSQAPSQVVIDGVNFYDDQAAPTQEYGVYISDKTDGVTLGGNNIFGTLKVSPYYLSPNSTGKDIRIRDFQGHPINYRRKSSVASAGTGTNTLDSKTAPANSLMISTSLRIKASGRATGTAGTKIVRVQVGSTSVIISNQAAADQLNWALEATLIIGANASRTLQILSPTPSLTNVSYSTSAPLTIAITSTAAGGDTVTLDSFSIVTE